MPTLILYFVSSVPPCPAKKTPWPTAQELRQPLSPRLHPLILFWVLANHARWHPPPSKSKHPATSLLSAFSKEGVPVHVGAPWTAEAISAAIQQGPHVSTRTEEATSFCREELVERVSRGFSILLTTGDAQRIFGTRLRISRLASVPQKARKNRLICDSTAPPPGGDSLLSPQDRENGITPTPDTPAVNASTDKASAPSSMQFGPCLPRLLQKIWEADPAEGRVLLSKWDVSDAFHRCPLRPADVGAFAYVVPPLPGDATTYLCVDLVLPMGWVNSPPFFCAASETAADLANVYLHDGTTTFVEYAPTKGAYSTSPSPTASAKRLQAVEVYMDDLMGATQGDPTQQRRATEIMLRAIKEVFPSVVGELKDSVSIKKALQGDGSWSWMKEILGWDIDEGILMIHTH